MCSYRFDTTGGTYGYLVPAAVETIRGPFREGRNNLGHESSTMADRRVPKREIQLDGVNSEKTTSRYRRRTRSSCAHERVDAFYRERYGTRSAIPPTYARCENSLDRRANFNRIA